MRGNKNGKTLSVLMLVSSMVIFGTVGIFRRYIPLGSATLAAARGFIGVVTIALVLLTKKQKTEAAAIRRNLTALVFSGAFIGINWILLFEAYGHTTVAVATLCYYMAPVFAIIGAAIFLREKLTLKKVICIAVATLGMVCISGIFGGDVSGSDFSGILYGLGAALFYASVIVINQTLDGIRAFDRTVVQLLCAAVVVTPYALLTEDVSAEMLTLPVVLLVVTVGVLHTGIAYSLYFGSMDALPTDTVALLGYVDPLIALILSAVLLREPFGIFELVGVICIFGATICCELPTLKIRQKKDQS